MKKTLLYAVAAAILGILVIFIPLIAVAQVGSGSSSENGLRPSLVYGSFGRLEGQPESETPAPNDRDLGVLAISFVIALGTCTLFTRRASRRYYLRLGVPPY